MLSRFAKAGKRGSAVSVLGLTLLVLGATACGTASRKTASQPVSTVSSTASAHPSAEASTEDLIARVRSGIVKIDALSCNAEAVGTGFLIGPRLVATVDHVVSGATKISLIRNGQRIATGRVIGSDPSRDLALIQTSAPVRGFVFKFADRSPRLGERVIALGFPLNLPLTVTQGSVSGLARTIPIDGVRRRQLVQTDAAVNHGNSGGPLLSTDTGEVLGLVDLGSTTLNGTAFAVSASVAGGLDEAWKTAPQPLAPAGCSIGSDSAGQTSSTPTTTTTAPAEAIPSGVYTWANTPADLKAQHFNSSYIAENAGTYTMSLSGGNWTLLQKSGTAKHTLLTGQYETDGDGVTFTIAGPTGDSQIGTSWSATWAVSDSTVALTNFSNPAWGGVMGLHTWQRIG
jgi:hypothetical protein